MGAERAAAADLILADTKFEFGTDAAGELYLIDEVLTPDSSRFWPKSGYAPGGPQPSFDKQFVRDYLEGLDWDKTPPAPALTPAVLEGRCSDMWRRTRRWLASGGMASGLGGGHAGLFAVLECFPVGPRSVSCKPMSGWLIEMFGSGELQRAFYAIALMTAPVWLAMACFPEQALVRLLAHPWVLPPCYCVVLGLLFWKGYQQGLLPAGLSSFSYREAQDFSQHPMAFLLLLCNWQIVNLVLGTAMYQRALRSGFRVPLELLLCWLLGAWALLPFCVRLLLRRERLR